MQPIPPASAVGPVPLSAKYKRLFLTGGRQQRIQRSAVNASRLLKLLLDSFFPVPPPPKTAARIARFPSGQLQRTAPLNFRPIYCILSPK